MNYEHDWDRDSFDFQLTPESVVVELGGFHGRWCAEIARRYDPRLYVYEPQLWLVDELRAKLKGHSAEVFGYGLGTENAWLPMGEYHTDGCTFLPAGRHQGTGELREWYAEMEARHLSAIDLLLVNIEGYEFTLLPHIMPWLPSIRWLMVQWHTGAGGRDHSGEYTALRAEIERTHAVRFDYGAVLTCHERREVAHG